MSSEEVKVTHPTINLSTKQEVFLCWATTEFGDLGVQSIPNDMNPDDPKVFVIFNSNMVIGFFPCGSINVIMIKKDDYTRITFENDEYKVEEVISFVEGNLEEETESKISVE